MSAIFQGLAPIFLLIVLGYVLRRMRWVADAFWAPAEKLTYYLFFPALLLGNAAHADLGAFAIVPLAGTLLLCTLLVSAAILALRPFGGLDGPAFTSLFQGAIRPNSYVGIAAALALFSQQGLTLVAIAIVIVVPLVNFLCVSVMVVFAAPQNTRRGIAPILFEIIKNPLIIACFGGLGLNLVGLSLPPVLSPLIDILGHAALPVGLIAVGAGLSFKALHARAGTVSLGALAKLGAMPLLTFLIGSQFGLGGVELAVCVMYMSLPTSASSYVLARQLGGDGPLVAGMITASTILAMIALPLWVRLVL